MMNNFRLIFAGAIALLILIVFLVANPFSWNDAGNRTVVEQSGGKQFVQFAPGVFYAGFFSKEKEWPNQISVLYNAEKPDYNLEDNGIEIGMINVQFNDATTADLKGITQFILPSDEKEMILLHNTHRTPESLVSKRLAPYSTACLQSSAQLMSSEMHYGGGKAQLAQDYLDQLKEGPFLLSLTERVFYDSTESTRKRVYEAKLQIDKKTGLPKRKASSIKEYGITVADAQVTDTKYSAQVLTKISKIVDAATKSAISRQELMTAQQQTLTAKAKGEQALVEIEYAQKQNQTRQVVEAETKVMLAEQDKKQQEIAYQGAIFEARKTRELADAEAYAKAKVMLADGALDKKLAAWVEERKAAWAAFGAFEGNIVPLYQSGGAGASNGVNWMETMGANAAMEIGLKLKAK